MRILVANKFWYIRGGLERVMFDEIAGLQADGHTLAHFSTQHPENLPSEWSRFFVPYYELGAGSRLSAGGKIRAVAKMFWNQEAYVRFSALIREFRPDVIHIHGIHRQISPSILVAARQQNVPVVQTVHDYHHVCAADTLLRAGTAPCMPPRCRRGWHWPAVNNRCVRGSAAASAVAATELLARRITRAYERAVTRFICPSEFMRDVLVSRGWPSDRCHVVRNAVKLPVASTTRFDPGYFLYTGRLSAEKGVALFLEACERAGVEAVVAGDGPQRRELERRFPQARFLGRVGPEDVQRLMGAACACVVPSLCFENAPMAVLEPMAAGVPVIASRIGGIPELVRDGVDGLLVDPGDVDGLVAAMRKLTDDSDLRRRIGREARARVAEDFSPERHMAELLGVYELAVSR